MDKVLFANLITLICVVFVVITYQCKDYKKLLIFNSTSIVIYIIQYIILSAVSGALVNVIMLARNIVSYIFKKKGIKNMKITVVVFVLLVIGVQYASVVLSKVDIISVEGLICILPAIAISCSTMSILLGTDKMIRYMDIFACALFIYYNIHFKAYVCTVATCAEITSSIVYLYRRRNDAPIRNDEIN